MNSINQVGLIIFVDKSQLSVCHWNIGNAKDKLESANLLHSLSRHDLIFVSEIKSSGDLYMNGYVHYRCTITDRYVNRGGLCLFVRNSLARFVKNLTFDGDDAIWIEFAHIRDIVFGGIYIPPSDSSYFDEALFANLQEKIRTLFNRKQVVIGGDMNSRIGHYQSLSLHDSVNTKYYPSDDLSTNRSGRLLRCVCADNSLLILNNLAINILERALHSQGSISSYQSSIMLYAQHQSCQYSRL